MKPAYLGAVGVLAVSMVAVLFSFGGAVAHHVDIAQARAQPNRTVQVPGDILKETVRFDAARGVLLFDIADRRKPSETMQVVYARPKPENFDTARSVEAIGQYRDGAFQAHTLLVKCPSKYNDQTAAAQP
ncbi:MAG: cytochrome c maturation protein CcmE [Chthonomonadales bacterium]|nr:cytochrome c maturation protein CcmE [Chthonomonadales bacterium]